jgi:phosphoribosylformimino-5-aminoimidazole carboxamide ribotide isomerase
MTRFRPCIDLHDGRVKQIVGSSLRDDGTGLKTNFVSDRDAAWYAELYKRDGLTGGHVILLGKGNEEAAKSATAAFRAVCRSAAASGPAMRRSISMPGPVM